MDTREREMQEQARCEAVEEQARWEAEDERRRREARRRIDRFVSRELLEAVEWLRVEVEVMVEEGEEHTVQVLDETMERFLDHLEWDVFRGGLRHRAEALAAAAVAVVRYEMSAPYGGHDVKAWERSRTLGSLVGWARKHPERLW